MCRANCGRASNRSTSAARLAGEGSSRNARAVGASGIVPPRSSQARRRKSASAAGPAAGVATAVSTRASIRSCSDGSSAAAGGRGSRDAGQQHGHETPRPASIDRASRHSRLLSQRTNSGRSSGRRGASAPEVPPSNFVFAAGFQAQVVWAAVTTFQVGYCRGTPMRNSQNELASMRANMIRSANARAKPC